MVLITPTLPDTLEELKEITHRYEVENRILREQVRLLRAQLFGRKTEKRPSFQEGAQASLFDEAEAYGSVEEEVKEEIEISGHKRKKRGRKPLPEDLPRVNVIHDLSEEEKVCACGCMKSRIGEEFSEQLDIIPAKIQVIRHIRYKYVCKNCEGVEAEEGAVKIAPAAPQMIAKSIATAGLLAHVLTSKFVDALPFYRQEKQFARLGVEIPRSTMCGWAIQVAERSMPLIEFLLRDILSGPLINIDETTLQVMKEAGRSNTTKSYMWVFRGGDPEKPVLMYQYHPTRSGSVASEFLKGYKGYVQTDGYGGYDFLDYSPGIIHVGCWVHVRRNFVDIVKSIPKGKSIKGKKSRAEEAIEYIRRIYAIEKKAQLQGLGYEAIYEERQREAKPVLEEFHSWLITTSAKTPPQGLLGKAISYALKQWPRLIRYLEDGRLRPDNNLIENAIRPFVLGRKNWLFSGRPEGARASSVLYSLIETAKANDLEPYHYFRYIFEKLPYAETDTDYKALLPSHLKQSDLVTCGPP